MQLSLQTIFQLVLVVGVVLTAIGTYGSYHYGKEEQDARDRLSDKRQDALKSEISKLQAEAAKTNQKIELIYQAVKPQEDVWMEVEMKNIPGPIADYLLLLFASDKGRISGKARIKGSDELYTFSTTANNRHPVAIRNLWLKSEGQYKTPVVLQFSITERTDPDASFQIYTAGFIFSRGQEPH